MYDHSGPRSRQPALDELARFFGRRIETAMAVREQHSRDESHHAPRLPDAVFYAETSDEISQVTRIAARHRLPLIPFGAGTSLEGHVVPVEGGLTINLSKMNKIISVNPGDLDATVEAGVTREQLNRHLRDTGLFFPVDPGADATLGGMAATRASGTNAVRYGTMRENVVNLTAVMADGCIIRTASRAKKSSAGYDLTRLLVGSEGTLAIITEVTVRLYGVPETIAAGTASFPTVRQAIDAVVETIQSGIAVSRIEFLDAHSVAACNRYSGLDLRAAPTLFVELGGTPAAVKEQADVVAEIFAGHGCDSVAFATDPEARTRLWRARHQMHYALLAVRPGCRSWATDVCVPISSLAYCIDEISLDTAKAKFPVSLVGHAGDGNFHMGFLIDPSSEVELAEAAWLNERVVLLALALGGTCTGEHGVGLGKVKFMAKEHGGAVAIMRLIKDCLDPCNILNPGKILPDA
jgi:D-lactate dehydrogenase (cytochrome)